MKLDEIIYNNKTDLEKIDLLNLKIEQTRKENVNVAFELSKQAILNARELQYRKGLAKAYLNAGICCRLTSNFDEALKYLNDALSLYRELSDKKGETRTLNSIANIYLFLSNFPKAIGYFDECIFVLESIGDIEFEATVLSNRGLAYQQYGNLKSSLESYLQSLSIFKTCHKDIPYYLYNNLGIIYLEIGNYYIALKYFNHALKLEELGGKRLDEAFTLANIGRSYIYLKDFINAVTYLSEGLIILKSHGDRQAEAQIYSNLGKAYLNLRYFPEALKYFNRALKYYKEIKDKSSVSHTICELGELYFELNDFAACRKLHLEGLNIAVEIKDEINEARNYTGLTRLYIKFNDFESVANYSAKVIKLAEDRKAYKELVKIYGMLQEAYRSIGNTTAAKRYGESFNEYTSILNAIEDENLKLFTSYNNFDFKTEANPSFPVNGNGSVVSQNGNGEALNKLSSDNIHSIN